MKNATLMTLALCASLWAQDGGKRIVEQPLKKGLAPAPADKFDLSATGILWSQGLESALDKGKPILLFQLLGNYDDVYC